MLVLLSGLLTGLSLIIAIGAQNAYVLRQGVRREHVLPVAAICALSDLVLITVGVAGVGTLITAHPAVLVVARWGGAAFLLTYAALAVRRAVRGGSLDVDRGGRAAGLTGAVLTAVSLTWLNPHVYLDTVLLLGSIAGQHGATGRWWFGAGAGLGSVVWFTALGAGARLLTPLFARPAAWRVLDLAVAATMIAVAISLLRG